MIEVSFKNMESTELAKQIVEERLVRVVKTNPLLSKHRFKVEIERIHSGASPKPDFFKIDLAVSGLHLRHRQLVSKHPSLYQAIGLVCEKLLKEVS